jgi:hypothetical protein
MVLVQQRHESLGRDYGTYVEQPRLWSRTLLVPRIVEITFSGDMLFGAQARQSSFL